MALTLSGQERIDAPVQRVWDALIDPNTLQRCIPGCKQMDLVEQSTYRATLELGVAAVKGRFEGQVQLSDLVPPQRLSLGVQGEGANGFVKAQGHIELSAEGEATQLRYAGDFEVGGKIAGVGQRLLGGVSKFLAGQFFKALKRELSQAAAKESV